MEVIEKKDSWGMFNHIAKRYDWINRFLSCGIDLYWRSCLLKHIPKTEEVTNLLDIASGTGDQLFTILKNRPYVLGVGIDLSEKMLDIAKAKGAKKKALASFLLADAKALPASNASIDITTISFGIRNIDDPLVSLEEMHRVLKKGGKALILEFSLPKARFIRAPYLFYLRHILPKLGQMLSKEKGAYAYLSQTIQTFPHGKAFISLMQKAGFEHSTFHPLTFGIATLYVGVK